MAVYQLLAVATEAAGPQLLCEGLGLGSIRGAAVATHQQPPQSTRGYKVLQQRLPCSAADSLSHYLAVLRKMHASKSVPYQLSICTRQSPVCIRAAALGFRGFRSSTRLQLAMLQRAPAVHVLLICRDPEPLLWTASFPDQGPVPYMLARLPVPASLGGRFEHLKVYAHSSDGQVHGWI